MDVLAAAKCTRFKFLGSAPSAGCRTLVPFNTGQLPWLLPLSSSPVVLRLKKSTASRFRALTATLPFAHSLTLWGEGSDTALSVSKPHVGVAPQFLGCSRRVRWPLEGDVGKNRLSTLIWRLQIHENRSHAIAACVGRRKCRGSAAARQGRAPPHSRITVVGALLVEEVVKVRFVLLTNLVLEDLRRAPPRRGTPSAQTPRGWTHRTLACTWMPSPYSTGMSDHSARRCSIACSTSFSPRAKNIPLEVRTESILEPPLSLSTTPDRASRGLACARGSTSGGWLCT